MTFKRFFNLLVTDPGLLTWKIGNRIRPYTTRIPSHPVKKQINGVWFYFDFALGKNVERMYLGLYEVPLVASLRRYLRRGDTFIDIGANIGYISAVAAGLVGKTGAVHSFEPVPRFCQYLNRLAEENPDFAITANARAAGDQAGTAEIYISSTDNIGWNTMVPGLMPPESVGEVRMVEVVRLDEYIRQNSLRGISLIKIDAEGFELSVLMGFSGFLQEVERPPLFVVEVAAASYPRAGHSLRDMKDLMSSYSYRAYTLDEETEVNITELEKTTNVLFKTETR